MMRIKLIFTMDITNGRDFFSRNESEQRFFSSQLLLLFFSPFRAATKRNEPWTPVSIKSSFGKPLARDWRTIPRREGPLSGICSNGASGTWDMEPWQWCHRITGPWINTTPSLHSGQWRPLERHQTWRGWEKEWEQFLNGEKRFPKYTRSTERREMWSKWEERGSKSDFRVKSTTILFLSLSLSFSIYYLSVFSFLFPFRCLFTFSFNSENEREKEWKEWGRQRGAVCSSRGALDGLTLFSLPVLSISRTHSPFVCVYNLNRREEGRRAFVHSFTLSNKLYFGSVLTLLSISLFFSFFILCPLNSVLCCLFSSSFFFLSLSLSLSRNSIGMRVRGEREHCQSLLEVCVHSPEAVNKTRKEGRGEMIVIIRQLNASSWPEVISSFEQQEKETEDRERENENECSEHTER